MFNFFKKKFFQKESQINAADNDKIEKVIETEPQEPQIPVETPEFEEPAFVAETVEETHYEEFQPQAEAENVPQAEELQILPDNTDTVEEVAVDEVQEQPCEASSPAEYDEPQIQEEISNEVEYEQLSDKFFKLPFGMLKDAISKTTDAISGQISSIAPKGEKIDDDILDELEEILIKTDVGVDLAAEIVDEIRARKDKITTDEIHDIIKEEFKKVIAQAGSNQLNFKEGLNIFLITGVNGAGKTTLIGKLAHRFGLMGGKVLIAAGDTFRAAAEEQLDIWSKRAGADIVRKDGADSASVVFDAIRKAKDENYDVLLIDTAGRLQNKYNLMEELKKIKKVIDNEAAGQISESLLVLDANMGQNGLLQAEVFKEAVQITAVGLTKLDGSAKGGIIAGIAKKFNLPVKLIGVGEKIEDLKDFNADDFVNALFGTNKGE